MNWVEKLWQNVGLRAKTYSYLIDGGNEDKVCRKSVS